MRNDWKPGDPCAACGSTKTGWNIEQGGFCHDCGRCPDPDAHDNRFLPHVLITFSSREDLDEFLLEHQDRICTNVPDDNTYRIAEVHR